MRFNISFGFEIKLEEAISGALVDRITRAIGGLLAARTPRPTSNQSEPLFRLGKDGRRLGVSEWQFEKHVAENRPISDGRFEGDGLDAILGPYGQKRKK